MTARILPSIHREPTMQMKNKFLFDIYRKEGEKFFFESKYKEAIGSFNAALKIDPNNKMALMSRSRCYFEMGHHQRSLGDCEAVLAMNNTYPDAVYQKAEIFFALMNYEMALLFYHRGHKLGYKGFQEGIDRCKEAIKNAASGRTMKLTPAGDLTIYVHKKMQQLSSSQGDENQNQNQTGRSGKRKSLFRDPSVVTYNLNLSPNPLVRLDRKERARAKSYRLANRHALSHRPAANQRCFSDRPVNYRNETSNDSKDDAITSDRSTVKDGQGHSIDEKTMRIILGKLYGDKEYLENFVQKIDNQTHFESSVRSVAEDGLGFLFERILYWSGRSLQPSPPPSPPLSQKYIQQGGRDTREKSASPLSPLPRLRSSLWQREVSEFIRNLESSDDSGDDDVTTDERDKMMTSGQMKINPENINFVFRSVRPDSHNAGARERVTGSVRAGKRGSARGSAKSGVMSQIDEEGDLEEDSILVYLTRELRDIQEAFDKQEHDECIRRSAVCLQTVGKYSDEEISDKRDLVARIHSYLGNSLLEMDEYDNAIKHHEKDLEIGEECDLDEPISRALGNLGRAYFLKKQYNKALGAFARKTKLATQPVELAWLFHEIGNCFLCLNQYQHACACANKSLDAAVEASNTLYQLQSCVLLAVGQVKLEEYEVAHSTFERALDLASLQGDTQSEELIKVALNDVNTNISRELRHKLRIRGSSQCTSYHDQKSHHGTDDVDERRDPADVVENTDDVSHSDSDDVISESSTDELAMSDGEHVVTSNEEHLVTSDDKRSMKSRTEQVVTSADSRMLKSGDRQRVTSTDEQRVTSVHNRLAASREDVRSQEETSGLRQQSQSNTPLSHDRQSITSLSHNQQSNTSLSHEHQSNTSLLHDQVNRKSTSTPGNSICSQSSEPMDASFANNTMTSFLTRETTPPIEFVNDRESYKDNFGKEQLESEV